LQSHLAASIVAAKWQQKNPSLFPGYTLRSLTQHGEKKNPQHNPNHPDAQFAALPLLKF